MKFIINIYSKNNFFILCTVLCIFIIIHRIIKFKQMKSKILDLAQIAFFSSLATISRCFIKLSPTANGFLPIIILSSSIMDKNFGFVLGVLSVLISNIFLGQGPWTPWQMVAAGTVGYMSGLTFNNKKIKPTTTHLTLFYLICTIFIYCPIMNLFSLLLLTENINLHGITTYFFSLSVIDAINAFYSLIFLYILYYPIINTIRKISKIYKG